MTTRSRSLDLRKGPSRTSRNPNFLWVDQPDIGCGSLISSTMRFSTLLIAPLLALLPTIVTAAADTLYTDSVFYCNSNAGSVVEIDSFDLTYHKANNSVVFSFSLAAVQSGRTVNANLYVGAYGLDVVNQTLDLCSYFSGALCPLPLLNFSGESWNWTLYHYRGQI